MDAAARAAILTFAVHYRILSGHAWSSNKQLRQES